MYCSGLHSIKWILRYMLYKPPAVVPYYVLGSQLPLFSEKFIFALKKSFCGCLVSHISVLTMVMIASFDYSFYILCVVYRSMNKNCSSWLCLVWVQLQGHYLQIIWNQIMSIWWKNNLQWIQMETSIPNLLILQSKKIFCCSYFFSMSNMKKGVHCW